MLVSFLSAVGGDRSKATATRKFRFLLYGSLVLLLRATSGRGPGSGVWVLRVSLEEAGQPPVPLDEQVVEERRKKNIEVLYDAPLEEVRGIFQWTIAGRGQVYMAFSSM